MFCRLALNNHQFSPDLINLQSEIELVRANAKGSKLVLDGTFKEVFVPIDCWTKVSGEVNTLTLNYSTSSLVIDKNSHSENLILNGKANVYNSGKISSCFVGTKDSFFTNKPLAFLGDKAIVDYYTLTAPDLGDFTPAPPVEYPTLVISAPFDLLEMDYNSIPLNPTLEIDVEGKLEVTEISVQITNSGVTSYSKQYKSTSQISLSDLPFLVGVNIITVTATNSRGKTDRRSIAITRTVQIAPPDAPSLDPLSGKIDTGVMLNWSTVTPPSEKIDSTDDDKESTVQADLVTTAEAEAKPQIMTYTVLRSEQFGKYVEIATQIEDNFYLDKTASPDTIYSYVVRSNYIGVFSEYSNSISIQAAAKASVLFGKINGNEVTLNWNKSNGSAYYEVYKEQNGVFSIIAGKLLLTTFKDYVETTATYKIKSLNNEGKGEFSQELKVDASKNDSDKIGFTPNTDSDGDGLTDEEELLYGTDALLSDADHDGVDDLTEITLGTNPLKPDTDNDGIFDGAEVLNGTDPLVANIRGEKEITKETVSYLGTAHAKVTGKENFSLATLVATENDNDYFNGLDGIIGEPVTFTSGGFEFDEAVITLKYTDEQLAQQGMTPADLSIVYVNEETKKLETLESTINLDEKTVSAKTKHFSTYLLGNKKIQLQLENIEVVFAVERQYSYEYNDDYTTYKCGLHEEIYCDVKHEKKYCDGEYGVEYYCPGHFGDFLCGKKCTMRNVTTYCGVCKTSLYNCNGCKTRKVGCGKTYFCTNRIATHHNNWKTISQKHATNALETKVIKYFADAFVNNELKIGVCDNATTANNLSTTRNLNKINNSINVVSQIYNASPNSSYINNAKNLFSKDAKNKVVNYLYLYGDVNTLMGQVLDLYKNYGIKTNIISLHKGNVDPKSDALKSIAEAGKGAYFGLQYDGTTDSIDNSLKLIYTKLAKVWTFEEYVKDELPQSKTNLTFSDLYQGVEGEEVEKWITTASTNLLTGNYIHQVTDISYTQDSLALAFTRTYNSLSPNAEVTVGKGFLTNFGTSVSMLNENNCIVKTDTVKAFKASDLTEVDSVLSKGTRLELNKKKDSYSVVKMGEKELYVDNTALYYGTAYSVILPTGTNLTFIASNDDSTLFLPTSKIESKLIVKELEISYEAKDGLNYTYEKATGQLQKVTDKFGNVITVTFKEDRLEKATDTFGRSLMFSYNVNGLLSSVKDEASREVRYTYNDKNQLVGTYDLMGTRSYYTYNPFTGILDGIKDETKTSVMTNNYDILGRLVRQYDGNNLVKYFIYDDEV